MLKRVSTLSFIIGLFFTLIALVLLAGYFLSPLLSAPLNLFSGIAFLLFGVFMMLVARHEKEEE